MNFTTSAARGAQGKLGFVVKAVLQNKNRENRMERWSKDTTMKYLRDVSKRLVGILGNKV